MKLRNLVKYKQLVDSIDDIKIRRSINIKISTLLADLNTHEYDSANLKEEIEGCHLAVLKNLEELSDHLNSFKKQLNKTVETLEQPFYEKSKEIYKQRLNDSIQAKIDRQVFNNVLHNNEFKTLLTNRINLYVSSQYAGLQLAPGNGELTNHLVACNPLYLMDESEDMFRHIRNWRQPAYQNRLRYYNIDENQKDLLHELPANTLGLIVVVNWFNFRPIKIIKKYLQSMMKRLRPGGVIVFTYNNCDYPKAIDKVSELYYCYTTSKKVKDLCTQLGYNIIASYDRGYDELDMGISWLEIAKPGKRNTIKKSETMGLIKQLGVNE